MLQPLQQTIQTGSTAGFRQHAKSAVPPPSPSKKAMNSIIEVFSKLLWSEEPGKVIKALDAAVTFCNSPHAPAERDSLSKMGMHAIIVGVMNRHADNPKIQIRGCYVLILAMRLGLYSHETIGVVGGLRSVLIAMETFPDHATLQSNGCVFLFEFYRANTDYAEFARFLGPEMLIEAVVKHPHVEALQHSACGVIGNMSTTDEAIKARFIALGGIVHVAQVIQNFPAKSELQQVACSSMTTLMQPPKVPSGVGSYDSTTGKQKASQ